MNGKEKKGGNFEVSTMQGITVKHSRGFPHIIPFISAACWNRYSYLHLIAEQTNSQKGELAYPSSKLELDSNPGLSLKPALISLHSSDSQAGSGSSPHYLLPSSKLQVQDSAACLGLWDGEPAVLSPPCHYFLLLGYSYLFPFIINNRNQRCIHIGNKYPSWCECHKFLHDTNACILHCLHYVRK